jgi:MFS family permease
VEARTPAVVLVVSSAAQAAVSYVTFGLPAIGPELRSEFDLSLFELGAVLTASLFGSGLALIAAGVAVDRLGSRAAMLCGTALAVAGLAAAASADEASVLAAGLAVAGIGWSVVPIAGTGALFRVYPPARRGWALGVRQMAVPLGGVIGAATVPRLESLGGVALVLGVGAAAVSVTGVAFALVVEDGGRVPARARAFRTILGAPGMVLLLVVAACYIVVLQAVLSYTVPAARDAGLSSFAASAAYVAVNVTAMVARVVWGGIADRQEGSRRVRTLSEIGVVAAAGAVLFALALHGGAAAVLPAIALFGFGALGWNALVYLSAGERAAPELAGRSVAVAATVVFLVSALATPPLGALADRAGWDVFWVTMAAAAAAGALLASRLPPALAR